MFFWKVHHIFFLRQSRDIESAIPLSLPAINLNANENSDKAISHLTIIGLEF